jgi:CTP:molybdopterin cytidylyltransferase MocA
MGRPKQTLKLAGKPMLEHAVGTFLASRLQEVIVVVNPDLGWMPEARRRLRVVVNVNYREGIASSVRAGIEATLPDCDAVMMGLGDKPLLRSSTLEKLLKAYERYSPQIVVPAYMGQRGNPILFVRSLFGELGRLKGDAGAKVLLESGAHTIAEVPVRDLGVILDVNTNADLERAERILDRRASLAERKPRK